ncbi:p115 like vesicle tethering protein [Phanerochaete sordida]|uniref:P115 like vesicle tethering protein n=1 Tax=Phanerochaete sordida TaxID=48140 RepID=A0A9P3GQD8_9APHY|nr:p115 like vesicle tethering protein [Phanerochaete sordida]
MDFLSQTYIALRGPQGAPQTAEDAIARLSDRLSPATLLADRRAAVLSLKGLARDWRADIGEKALPGLLEVLQNDAEVDADIGKAVLETLNILCEVNDDAPAPAKELSFKHTDKVLETEAATHKLFALLGDQSFYLRLAILQYLVTLLQNRRQVVQGYFLKAPVGPTTVIATLEEKREIIRTEALTMLQLLLSQSPDIQKILAFEGAFEKLFNIVTQEGGVEGGVTVRDALTCVDSLLRFNTSNQSYFRETPLPPVLPSLLLFPPSLPPHEPAPQNFALQFWDPPQKRANASLVVNIMGILVNSKGGSPEETFAFCRCFIELGLSSNAPSSLKTQALRLLPVNLNIPLPSMSITPYIPVPESNGEEWDRMEPASALDALVDLVLHGEFNGVLGAKRSRDSMELRGAALGVFQNFVQRGDIREAIVQAMVPPEGTAERPPITPLLQALIAPPVSPLDIAAVTSTHFSTLLFADLIRFSPRAKALARSIVPAPPSADSGNFFVPADGNAPPAPEPEPEEEEQQTLLQLLSEHLSLALLSRRRADTSEREAREWDRLIVGYLCLLIQWLWEDPLSVRDFLEAGALGMLVEPINQAPESDAMIPALCAFLLGVCYEFNHEPGEITRTTIYPILTRLGPDLLVGRITHLRDDDRFRAVGPDAFVLAPAPAAGAPAHPGNGDGEREAEVWFDWAFVDFWKSNYYTIQRGIATDPKAPPPSAGQNAETLALVASLRETVARQAQELDALRAQAQEVGTLRAKVAELSAQGDEAATLRTELEAAKTALASTQEQLRASEQTRQDVEKEQEDLLVLLDELNGKRRRDKERMRAAGMDVSEDEDEGDEDEDDEE